MQGIIISILVILVPTSLAIVLLFFPHEIVRLQGRFYKTTYKNFLNQSDQEIDNRMTLPTDKWLMGRRSTFAREATDNPQRYSRLIRMYRVIGSILLTIIFIVMCLSIGALKAQA